MYIYIVHIYMKNEWYEGEHIDQHNGVNFSDDYIIQVFEASPIAHDGIIKGKGMEAKDMSTKATNVEHGVVEANIEGKGCKGKPEEKGDYH